jgi:hypothetical protein
LWQWGLAEGLFSLGSCRKPKEKQITAAGEHMHREPLPNVAAKGLREKQTAATREHMHKGALLNRAAKKPKENQIAAAGEHMHTESRSPM